MKKFPFDFPSPNFKLEEPSPHKASCEPILVNLNEANSVCQIHMPSLALVLLWFLLSTVLFMAILGSFRCRFQKGRWCPTLVGTPRPISDLGADGFLGKDFPSEKTLVKDRGSCFCFQIFWYVHSSKSLELIWDFFGRDKRFCFLRQCLFTWWLVVVKLPRRGSTPTGPP